MFLIPIWVYLRLSNSNCRWCLPKSTPCKISLKIASLLEDTGNR